MPNMSYCRFQNTLNDLRECRDHWEDDDLSQEETYAKERLLALCKKLADDYGEDDA